MLVLLGVCGCSSARYDADYAKAVADYRTRAEFTRLQDRPVELADGRVRIRPPKELPDALSENGPDPRLPPGDDGQVRNVPPRRLRPTFLEGFPGWAVTYEGLHGANAKLPATLSISLVPSAEMNQADVEADLLARLKKDEAFENVKLEWQSREVTDRDGAKKAWRVLEARGPQPIDRFPGRNEPIEESIETAIAVWLSAERGQEFCTLLAWRVPDEIKDAVKLDVLAPLVARSLAIAPPAN